MTNFFMRIAKISILNLHISNSNRNTIHHGGKRQVLQAKESI